jgi:Fe2+ transport system protein B
MTKAIRWTPEQLAAWERRKGIQQPKPPEQERRAKYGNSKVEANGETFDSRKEARRWQELLAMEVSGQITALQRQVSFELAPAVHLEGESRKKPALRYIADAVYTQDGKTVVEDTKSEATRKTAAYRIKKHLCATVLGIHIKET